MKFNFEKIKKVATKTAIGAGVVSASFGNLGAQEVKSNELSVLNHSEKNKRNILKESKKIAQKELSKAKKEYYFEENLKESDRNFPEKYAQSMLEYQNSKEYNEKIKESINYANQKVYDLSRLISRVQTDSTLNKERKESMLDFNTRELKIYKATYDTLINNPNVLKKNYEELLKVGQKIQIDAIEDLKEFNERQKVLNNMDKLIDKIDTQRTWIYNIMQSSEYKKRLEEYEKLSDVEFLSRINRVKDLEYNFSYNKDDISNLSEDENGLAVTFEVGDANKYPYQGIHEYEHVATMGDFEMSEYAKNLYMEGLNKDSIYGDIFLKITNGGEISPSEIDARKKVFEYELEMSCPQPA